MYVAYPTATYAPAPARPGIDNVVYGTTAASAPTTTAGLYMAVPPARSAYPATSYPAANPYGASPPYAASPPATMPRPATPAPAAYAAATPPGAASSAAAPPAPGAYTAPPRGIASYASAAPFGASPNAAPYAAGPPPVAYAPAPRPPAVYAPGPDAYAPAAPEGPYTLDSGDRLRIVVFGQDGLTNSYIVGATGHIDMPLIGSVMARGATTDQLAARIAEQLRNGFIREPHVAVEVEAYRPFFILGEVTAPGQYPYVANMTAETAVAIAGGFTPRALRKGVMVSRNYLGRQIRIAVPLTFPLRPGDTVNVQERWF